MGPLRAEHALLLQAATTTLTDAAVSEISDTVADGIDWTILVGDALKHNVLPLLDRSLRRLPPGLVPEDLDAALAGHCADSRARSEALATEIAGIIADLASRGITALPIKGPVLAQQAYGDIGLRSSRDLDVLVRERDATAALDALAARGYVRGSDSARWTPAQTRRMRRAEGQELLWHARTRIAVEPHWALAPDKLSVAIDIDGLFSRSRPIAFRDGTIPALSPEDTLQVLALHGGKETWWRLNWICDIAELVRRFPDLDHDAILARARPQGCRRMILLALALAHRLLGAPAPRIDRSLDRLVDRIVERLFNPDVVGPPKFNTVSTLRLGAHDGFLRRCDYVVRTLIRPMPRHIKLVALPDGLGFGYVGIKLVHDFVLLPAWRLVGGGRWGAS